MIDGRARSCSVWTNGLRFNVFQNSIQCWNQSSKTSELKKYHRVLESLKGNNEIVDLKHFVNEIVIPIINEEGVQTE